MTARLLIVNADDFGQTAGINRGVIRAHEDGIVTSASLMVRWPAAEKAARYARMHHDLSLGLHVDLGEWVYQGGRWDAWYEVVEVDDADAVEAEANAQLENFRKLVERDPTHLDSHQHVHREDPLRTVMTKMSAQIGVPVRSADPFVSYSGTFYGATRTGEPFPEAITAEALVETIFQLPEGVTELGCHPGADDGTPLVYRQQREQELRALCAEVVKEAVRKAGVTLGSFHDLATFTAASPAEE